MSLEKAIRDEMRWDHTENGADTYNTTGSKRLDFFAQSGSMRELDASEKQVMFKEAWREDARDALVLLFHTRNIRGGYGERDTFNQLLHFLGDAHPDVVEKNLWAVLEFGRAKDLYNLIGTKAEDAMWKFMKNQFELDLVNMEAGKSISLLAKWIATPDSSSENTRAIGKLTAKKLGYNFKNMREYKNKLRKMRAYLDIPEAKMCTNRWNEIEYSKCASKFLLQNRRAFEKHDSNRWQEYLDAVSSGDKKMNMSTTNPCDIFNKVYNGEYDKSLDVMWQSLPNICPENAIVMCDTSGSMWFPETRVSGMYPGAVAWSLAAYFAERNKGCLNRLFMTFDDNPKFVELTGDNLKDYMNVFRRNSFYGSTNLESAFDLLLKMCVKNEVSAEDMPKAIIVISDMQINSVKGINSDGRICFFNEMQKRYEEKGYKLPQVVFWNVAVRQPSFLASGSDNGASLVSGYSVNILKNVLGSIGSSPYELMRNVIDQEMYEKITL